MLAPVMLEVGPLRTYYYGAAYATGLLVVSLWIYFRRETLGYTKGEVAEFSLAFAVGVLAGGRLFNVFLYEWSYFKEHPLAVFALWQGGMATHGVMLGAALPGAAFCLYRGKSFLALADEVVIPGTVLLGLGRIGNHINGEVFGSVTNLPWATGFPYAEGCRHPVALYDGLKNLLLVPILLGVRFAYRRAGYEPPPGALFGHFVFWYGSLRLLVDVFREYDSYWLGSAGGSTLTSLWRSRAFRSSSWRTFWPVIMRPCDPQISISERLILAASETEPWGQRWRFSRSW